MSHLYKKTFFDYQQIGSLASAQAVVPLILRQLKPLSVLDVGCGAGAWVAAYVGAGAADVIGIDAGYLPREQLLFDVSRFHAVDVAGSFSLGRTFDMVQCLEVAEHLDPCTSEILVDNLVAHAPIVVFSAAPPGQGGEHHINERPYEFWRDLFGERGYSLFDFLRPQIRSNLKVEPWYRYNILVFMRQDAANLLEPAVAATRIDARAAVPDVSPMSWRVRRRLLSVLPPRFVTRLATIKHGMVLRRKHAQESA